MKFSINSARYEAATKPPAVVKLEKAARSLKDGQLLTLLNLAAKAGMSIHSAKFASNLMDKSFRCKPNAREFYYGNSKTIAAFKKEYGIRD